MTVCVFQRHERHCGRVENSILAHHDRGLYFHPDAGGIGLLGSGYPMAAFLSILDVHRHRPSEFSANALGIFVRRDSAVKLVDDLAGESPVSADYPVGAVVISGDGTGDQTVGSLDVNALEGWT
jgi:hypothetical protein